MILEFKLRAGEDEKLLISRCRSRLKGEVRYFRILKKSLDARDPADIRWVYAVECDTRPHAEEKPALSKVKGKHSAVIAGTGPAGLFCALRLIRRGITPILLERGKCVEERRGDVRKFFETGVLDPASNVQFGEGGAGTFSDGKLNTQTNSPLNRAVIEAFLAFGAPEEIGYLGKPHIGSDRLARIISNIRNYILAAGGEVRFSTALSDIFFSNGAVHEVLAGGDRLPAENLVLAIGHSARDTFEMLLSRGFVIEQKEFAAGVRIEHLQEKISRAQYKEAWKLLPPADYKLVSHAGQRAAFTFCMCPGGVVIPSASEEGGVVVNGMSDFARAGRNANSALVVQVKREDFASDHPLAGMIYQRKLEQAAFRAGGGAYRAPVQRVEDFLNGKASARFGEVLPTYARGTAFARLDEVLPAPLGHGIALALGDMDRRLHGFAHPDALLLGVESRTSSPVRIVRDESLQAAGKAGVYPCGEGCGYAGGITSAAADGIRVAEAIAAKYL